MLHYVFPLLALFASVLDSNIIHAQVQPDTIARYRSIVDTIVREALRNGQAYRNLKELCQVAPHRLAGSVGAAAAVEWARQTMIREGLENVRLEPCMVPHWERGNIAELRIVSPPEAAGEKLSILALGRSIATPAEGITAEVIEVKSFDELKNLGQRARGKIIFFNRPMDKTILNTFRAYGGAVDQRSRGAIEAAQAGGVAAIIRSVTTRLDDVPHTGAMHYEEGVKKLPGAAISTLGADRLAGLLATGKNVTLHLRMDSRTLDDAPSYNVIGELPGREYPEEIVLVSGHLDAWDVGQGAHDDGAGISQAIEVARLLKKLGLIPRRTIRVVLFMHE
jgi:Iap family predicted aminopeptidase